MNKIIDLKAILEELKKKDLEISIQMEDGHYTVETISKSATAEFGDEDSVIDYLNEIIQNVPAGSEAISSIEYDDRAYFWEAIKDYHIDIWKFEDKAATDCISSVAYEDSQYNLWFNINDAVEYFKEHYLKTTYREYAKNNGHSEEWIENSVDGLFGADVEMEWIDADENSTTYSVGNYFLISNNSSFDIVESRDEDGIVLESWTLDDPEE